MVNLMKQTNNLYNNIIYFVYQKALIQTFQTSLLTFNNLCVNSLHENPTSKGYFVLKKRFKT